MFDFQNLNSGTGGVNQYKVSYNPHHPAHQPKMFNSQAIQQEGQFDHLQREFLDSTQRESYDLYLFAGIMFIAALQSLLQC